MIHGEKTYTEAGNTRAPSMDTYLQWIVDAWEQLPKELIIKSFKGCGLTNALDGSEDALIHCFKPDGPIPSEPELLQQKREDAQFAQLWDAIDLAQDDDSGYESNDSIDFETQ